MAMTMISEASASDVRLASSGCLGGETWRKLGEPVRHGPIGNREEGLRGQSVTRIAEHIEKTAYITNVERNSNVAKLQAGYLFPETAMISRRGIDGLFTSSFSRKTAWNPFHWIFVLSLVIGGWIVEPSLAYTEINSDFSQLEIRKLRLGQELIEEKLPFRGGGKCIYELIDMREAHWYEVKISYPASTPAIFSIDFLPEHDEHSTSSGRKLLNTEKIIFHHPKGPASQGVRDGIKQRVLVSVRPEGFVAQPYVQEQMFMIYNILLEEVVLGIPLQAFWVGFLGLISLCASVLAARQTTIHLQHRLEQFLTKSTKRAL